MPLLLLTTWWYINNRSIIIPSISPTFDRVISDIRENTNGTTDYTKTYFNHPALKNSVFYITTPIAKIFHCLETMKVPKILIEIGLLMYNTIFIFLNEIDTMQKSQKNCILIL